MTILTILIGGLAGVLLLVAVVFLDRRFRSKHFDRVDRAHGRKQQRILQSLVDNVADGIIVAADNGEFLVFNPAAKRILGVGPMDVEWTDWSQAYGLYYPDAKTHYPPEQLPLVRALRGETVGDIEICVKNKKRPEEIFVSGSATPILDETGRPCGGVVIFRDITEKRKADLAFREENLHLSSYLKLLLESTGEGIYGIDLDARCTFINPAGAQIIGYEPEELIGKNMHDLIHSKREDGKPYPRNECPILSTLTKGISCRVREEVLWRKDGHSFPAWYSAYPIFEEGKITGAVVAFTDVTDHKKIERMKNEFVSTVSHELRTPLTSIRGSLGLVAAGMAGKVPEKAKALLNIAVNNCERLVRLINDILDMEKIESGRMVFDLKPLALIPLIEKSIEANQAFAGQYEVRLRLENPPSELQDVKVNGDSDRLMQAMTNLLSNAAKFSSSGQEVKVRVGKSGKTVRVSVADQGPGIPEEFKSRIFKRFSQADSSDSRQRGGTGLGLSITKAIVERHGGKIGFETKEGSGTTFYFDLAEWKTQAVVPPPWARSAPVSARSGRAE